ncbi:hypothetical protein Tco_0948056 [Tanacetum coccineum]
MVNLEFCDKHNMVAYLVKSEGSKGFHEIIDFLTSSHIYYALTECPTLYISLIEQFWQTAALSTTEDGVHAITATIDGRDKLITEASIRRHLKLQDSEDSTHKFLMYPRFIQILLNKQQRLLLPHTRTYPTPTLTNKLFNNMRRACKGYSRVVIPLFDTMLVQPQGEAPSTFPSRITSSPSLSSHHTTSSTPTTSPSIQITHEVEETATMPHDSPLLGGHTPRSNEGRMQHTELMELITKLTDMIEALEKALQQTKKTYSTALTKLVLKVKKLEKQVRSGKARRRARIVLSEDEDIAEDLFKQERKIAQIDIDPTISLVQDEGTSWFQEDVETQEKNSADTEVLLEEETPSELIEDLGSGEKGEKEISTSNVPVSTAGAEVSTASHDVSTAAAALVYIRRSASKDKGKAIMQEPEPPKKLKKRVQVQINVDEELARKNRPYSVAEVRKNMVRYLINQGGYKQRHFKGMSYQDIRPIFEKVWDQNQVFVPMGSEIEKEHSKPVEEETVHQKEVKAEQVVKESPRKTRERRKKSLARKRARETQSEESSKKQKLEDDAEKEELRLALKIVSDKDKDIDYEVLDMKYKIVDWES